MLAEIARLYLLRYSVYTLLMNAVLSKSWKCRFLEERGNSMTGSEKFLQSSVNITAGAFLTSVDDANSFQTITRNDMPFIADTSLVCRLKSSVAICSHVTRRATKCTPAQAMTWLIPGQQQSCDAIKLGAYPYLRDDKVWKKKIESQNW